MSPFLANILFLAQQDKPVPPEEPGGLNMTFFLTMIVIFIAFYMLIALPQRRAQEQKTKVLETMKKGVKVISAGGIHGTVVRVDNDKGTAVVQVAKGVEMTFNKTSLNLVEEQAKEKENGGTKKK